MNLNSNSYNLDLIKESEHGLFFSPIKDEKTMEMIEELAHAFEKNYNRIVDMFMYTPNQKTIVHVYSDREQFYQIIGRKTEGTYDASDNIIKLYTPQSLDDPDIHLEYTFQIVHEFVHEVIQQINPMVGKAKWLDEGTAYFASLQLDQELKNRSKISNIPTLEQLTNPTFYDNFDGSAYFICGLIVKFITEKYGINTLNEFIRRNPEGIEEILNISLDRFYLEWKQSLQ